MYNYLHKWPKMLQRCYKSQTKHADRMILPSSSQKYLQRYLWVPESRETDCRKSRIFVIFFLSSSSSFSYKLLTSSYSLPTKAVIELLHTQNDIALVILAPFSPFVCKLAREAVLATPFWTRNKRSRFRRTTAHGWSAFVTTPSQMFWMYCGCKMNWAAALWVAVNFSRWASGPDNTRVPEVYLGAVLDW